MSKLGQEASVRQNRFHLSEKQQLVVGLSLIILLAISMLYCLGFASVALHQVWERIQLPGSETDSVDEMLELTTIPTIEVTATGPAPH